MQETVHRIPRPIGAIEEAAKKPPFFPFNGTPLRL